MHLQIHFQVPPGIWMSVFAHCRAPEAWLTGPSKNGADINRLGRSHVSVYTGRPRSSTTRALDSLCTANSHTIYLRLVQKHLLITTCIQCHGPADMLFCTFLLQCSHTQICLITRLQGAFLCFQYFLYGLFFFISLLSISVFFLFLLLFPTWSVHPT